MNNQVPGDIFWCHLESLDGDVLYQATGVFPNAKMNFRPVLCNHCEAPLCVVSCPTGAMSKDPDTGIVLVDAGECNGCGNCVEECPYSVPVIDESSGDPIASKCTFCYSRVVKGELPYCVESCCGVARLFGDLDDPNSEASIKIAEKDAKPWMEEKGTRPSVYYF